MEETEALPELAAKDYLFHAEAFASTGFWAVARRLPALMRESFRLAWAANRRDTVLALGLQMLAGMMTTLGLLATSNVLASLFSDGPTQPSSAPDAKAEHAFFAHLRQRPDRITILITHRLANVRFADVIHVFHEGRLEQSGTHDELMSANARYADLFRLQAAGYLAD